MKKKPEAEEENIICELNAPSDAPLYECERSFNLKVSNDGPLATPQPGATLKLTPETAKENFFGGRIRPLFLKEGDCYVCIRAFRHTEDSKFTDVKPGDIISLSIAEACHYLRKQYIAIAPKEVDNAVNQA